MTNNVTPDHERAHKALVRIIETIRGAKVPPCFELVPELVVRAVEELVAEHDALRGRVEEHRASATEVSRTRIGNR